MVCLILSGVPLWGLTIDLTEAPVGSTLTPVFDPNLDQLGAIMQAAANFWEGIILNNHTLEVTYGYLDLAPAVHGIAEVVLDDGLRATEGNVAFDIENNMAGDWFFDPTPTNHSEFSMHQVLFRDLAAVTQGLYYNGAPNDVLEVGYWGNYTGPDQGRDALTTAIHELGHLLGLASNLPNFPGQTGDGDYDFNPLFVQGDAAAVEYAGPGGQQHQHLRSSDSTMAEGAGNGDRNLPGATDLFALASVSNWTLIDLPRKDFWGGAGNNWNASANWPGNRLPDAQDIVHVRNDATASLTSANGAAGNLFIQEESVVSTGSNSLNVNSKLTIEGAGPGLQATLVVNTNGRVTAQEIELNDGGLLSVTSGVTEEVNADIIDINPGGTLLGNGDVRINTLLTNDGSITAIAGLAGDELSLLTGPVDLDGTGGAGRIFAVLGNVRIAANVADALDGEMTIGAGRQIQFANGWQLGQDGSSDAEIVFQGSATETARLITNLNTAQLVGGSVTVNGLGAIDGNVTFNSGVATTIHAGAELELNGTTTLQGGSYQGQGTFQWDGPV
ncbi:MAG TPA: hypothetical protein VIY86_00510, partial [Pirellulaceae bacterium]